MTVPFLTRPSANPPIRPTPESELAAVVTAYFTMPLPTDWSGIEKLPGIRWAQLPPTSLQNCLPDGGCFTRQGSATIGGRNLALLATGARTMVTNLLIRNGGAAFGEPALVAALQAAGLGAELARCPVAGGTGSTNWYRVKGAASAGYFSIQAARPGRGEGFVLSYGDKLPALQPNQLALYREQCAPGAAHAPVSTLKPHEHLAQTVTGLLVTTAGPVLYDWKTLRGLNTGITWDTSPPRRTDLTTLRNDPSPLALSGHATWAGREFSAQASGTANEVKNIYLEENGLHPRGEHMLGVVYEKGFAVQLVRCGPVYTESTNNWYRITSSRTRTAMILQSIRYDGNNVQDSYALRLDGTLPTRDSRDRNPGVNGCQ
jgi:hypothetical protein